MSSLPLKTLGKRLLSLLYTHRQGNLPDIFIFSTQRSGSTLLFDMVASQPGFKAVGEPLQERKRDAIRQYLPYQCSRYAGFDTADFSERGGGEAGKAPEGAHEMARGMETYLRDLLAGKFVCGFERTYDLRNPRHHFRSERNAVKILRATHLLPWFAERFAGEFLLLVRHPVPTALSRTRNGWEAPLDSFIAQRRWFESLSDAQREFVHSAEEESLFRRHIVVWCLEHSGVLPSPRGTIGEWSIGKSPAKPEALRTIGNRVLFLHYEDLVAQPYEILPYVAECWQLPEPDRFVERFTTPSRSSKYSAADTKTAIGRGDAQELLSKWKSRVSAEDLEFTGRALELFEIQNYRADEVMPLT